MGFYILLLIMQFFSRKFFLEYLGTEVLGLNSTLQNILQFLNLAELGISAAAGFTLYKPLSESDYDTINEVVSLQGYLYKRIGVFVLCVGVLTMMFFPLIFKKINLPFWYPYAAFSVFLVGSLLSYFVNYRQIVLTANQQDYKVQLCYKPVLFIKLAFQIIAVRYSSFGFVLWLILELIGSIASAILLQIETKQSAPYLKKVKRSFKSLTRQYHDFTIKIKQLFVHRIAQFVLSQTSPLIIYGYLSLTVVALYGNYHMIMLGISMFVNAAFNSVSAGVGSLVVSSTKDSIIRVYKELFSLRFFVATFACSCIYILTPDFISLWIGAEYLLPNSTLILMLITVFIGIIRGATDNFLFAYGLYQDIYAPMCEAVLNLGLSILLGYFYGLNGVLSGVIISLLIIILGWKPYFLFTKKLKGYFIKYHLNFVFHIILAGISIALSFWIMRLLNLEFSLTTAGFIYKLLYSASIIGICQFAIFYIFNTGIRSFVVRLIK